MSAAETATTAKLVVGYYVFVFWHVVAATAAAAAAVETLTRKLSNMLLNEVEASDQHCSYLSIKSFFFVVQYRGSNRLFE